MFVVFLYINISNLFLFLFKLYFLSVQQVNADIQASRDKISSYDSQITESEAHLESLNPQFIQNMKTLNGIH